MTCLDRKVLFEGVFEEGLRESSFLLVTNTSYKKPLSISGALKQQSLSFSRAAMS